MSGQSLVPQKRSIALPLLGGLIVIILALLCLIYCANWFSINSPFGKFYQGLVGVLFFSVLLIAPIILTAKTKWPIWFIGLGCGFVSTALVQIGVHGTPADADALGSLLFIGFVFQSIIATGIALVSLFVLKKLRKGVTIADRLRLN
jgi:hypothetical protein